MPNSTMAIHPTPTPPSPTKRASRRIVPSTCTPSISSSVPEGMHSVATGAATAALKCGHELHPSIESYVVDNCPECLMKKLLNAIEISHRWIDQIGGIMANKNQKPDPECFLDQSDYKKKFCKWSSTRNELNSALRGWSKKSEKVRKRALGEKGEGGWRAAKTKIANLLIECEENIPKEKKWEEEFSLGMNINLVMKVRGYSAAMRAWEENEAKIRYCPGDPVSMPTVAPRPPKRKRDDDAPEEEIPSTSSDEKVSRPKRKPRVSFNPSVTVSPPHLIDTSISFPVSTLQRVKATFQKPKETYIALKDTRDRKQHLYNRYSVIYTPGPWASPPGHVKMDTSWYKWSPQHAAKKMDRNQTEGPAPYTMRNFARDAGWVVDLFTQWGLNWGRV